jgi:hypothetical protein
VTEDDYIRYLATVRWEDFFPAMIGEHLAECHYLFLGHSLGDWNLRVMLHQIKRSRWIGPGDSKIWAVKKPVEDFESEWGTQNQIQMIEADLSEFIPDLRRMILDQVPTA